MLSSLRRALPKAQTTIQNSGFLKQAEPMLQNRITSFSFFSLTGEKDPPKNESQPKPEPKKPQIKTKPLTEEQKKAIEKGFEDEKHSREHMGVYD